MIRWLDPAALAGLALLALPILIHLFQTRQAERVQFPSLRFVLAARTAAVRFRPPADWLLLSIRLAIVAAAVCAVAGPVIVTPARLRAWNERVARAVIVDASAAMSTPDASGRTPLEIGREAASAETRSATNAERIETSSLSEGVVRAAAWLSETPPARREIVVLSAFTEGTLRETDLGAVPAGVGLRLVRVGEQAEVRRLPPVAMLSAPGTPARVIDTELSGPATRLRLSESGSNQSGLSIEGADPQSREVQGLMRVVAHAGAPAPSPDEPLVCVFGTSEGGALAVPIGPESPRWMLRTLMRLQSDRELRRASSNVTGLGLKPSDTWTVVAADRTGDPLVRVATRNGQLLMQTGVQPESLVAAVAVRALLVSRTGELARPDQEIQQVAPEVLSAWSRPAAGVDADAWRRVESSDSRWFWLAALALLGLEQRMRRSRSSERIEIRDAA
jgi:hypothetical protein